LSNAVNATITTSTAVGTIQDDANDLAPSLSIIGDIVTEVGPPDSIGATFTVALSSLSGKTIIVDFATADSTAEAGKDYRALADTLTFDPGTLQRTITVQVLGDLFDENDEYFRVALSNAVNASITTVSAVGTIQDDTNDAPPSLSIVGDIVTEVGSPDSVGATFTVTLSSESGKTVTVDFATADSTAEAGKDYRALADSLTFSPGTIQRTVTVWVLGDNLSEPVDEAFFVNLTNPVNATISIGSALGIIEDEDPLPIITNLSFSWMRPCSIASQRANGIEAAEVLPYRSKLVKTLSSLIFKDLLAL
jgi:hypothetical protein